MYSKKLSFIDKEGNNLASAMYIHNSESVKQIVKSYNSKGFIVVIEDSPLPNAGCYSSKGYRL